MQKGILSNSQNSPLKFLKEGESIIVGVHSIDEFVTADVISAYNPIRNESIFLPVNIKSAYDNGSLYEKASELLWNDYNEAVAKYGAKSVETKEILSKINMIKPQKYIYFGFKDINTNEDVVLSMGIALKKNDHAKAGNNLLTTLKKSAKFIDKYPLELTKGAMGNWNVIPYMDDLTPEQQKAFDSISEIDIETYEACMFLSTPETELENMIKFSEATGFDLSRIGLSKQETLKTDNSNKYGF